MTATHIVAAIMWLCPQVGTVNARVYAREIVKAQSRGVDPLLVTALIYRESRFRPKARSGRNYGLGQVRVSQTTNPRLIGREVVLYNPVVNIRYTLRMLTMWRAWHKGRCGTDHPWFAHYQWGRRVRNLGSAKRVGAVYRKLVRRFRVGVLTL